MNTERRTILDILGMKGKEKIAALTAYDVQFASILDEAGLDLLLVGVARGRPRDRSASAA